MPSSLYPSDTASAADLFAKLVTAYCALISVLEDDGSTIDDTGEDLKQAAYYLSVEALGAGLMFDDVLSARRYEGYDEDDDVAHHADNALYGGAFAHPIATSAYRIAASAHNISRLGHETDLRNIRFLPPGELIRVLEDPDVRGFLQAQNLSLEHEISLEALVGSQH